MSAADNPKRLDGRPDITVVLASGETVTLSYRKAVGLLSLKRATLAPKTKRSAKKSSVSTAGGNAQDRDESGNKPTSGAPDDSGRD